IRNGSNQTDPSCWPVPGVHRRHFRSTSSGIVSNAAEVSIRSGSARFLAWPGVLEFLLERLFELGRRFPAGEVGGASGRGFGTGGGGSPLISGLLPAVARLGKPLAGRVKVAG